MRRPRSSVKGDERFCSSSTTLWSVRVVHARTKESDTLRRPGTVTWHGPAGEARDDGVGMALRIIVQAQVKGPGHGAHVLVTEERLNVMGKADWTHLDHPPSFSEHM